MSKGINLGKALVLAQTDRKLKVKIEKTGTTFFVPRSMVHDDSEVWLLGHDGDLVVLKWWAVGEGLA